jgi:hypothetical protein
MVKRKRILVEVDPEFHYHLFIRARQERVNISELVREYLGEWMKKPPTDRSQDFKQPKEA